jgi:hypothetical protein
MGIEFKIMTTPSDIEGVFSQLKRLLERNINSPVKGFSSDVEKKFYDILLRAVTKNDALDNYNKIKDELLKKRTVLNLKLEDSLNEILSSFMKKQSISNEAKKIIFTSVRDEYLADMSSFMFSIENNGLQSMIEVIRLNQKYDYEFLQKELMRVSPDELPQMFKDYRNLVKSDYQQNIMNELMNNPKIQKQFQEGNTITLTFKDGKDRNFDIEKYLNQRSDWVTTQTIRTVKETEVVESGTDVVMFVIVDDRPVKEPRPHHVEHENKIFSLDGSTKEYDGEPIEPISVIEEYEPFNSPLGCRHGLILPPEITPKE